MNTISSPILVTSCSHSELRSSLQIGGFIPLTTLDYPDHLSCVIFCQGCAWRCRYCHNPQLIAPRAEDPIAWHNILNFLKKRQGLLEAVVFSGGEPTLQKNLIKAIQEVKAMGFLVGIHSAGIKPSLFKQILPHIDWVGFDIKALPEDHFTTTCTQNSGQANWLSLDYLLTSRTDYEVRTTVHWHLFNSQRLLLLANKLAAKGVRQFVVQLARSNKTLDTSLPQNITPLDSQELWDSLNKLFPRFILRGNS